MAHLEAIRREQQHGVTIESRSGTRGAVAFFLIVVAVAALGEVVGERTAVTVEAPRPSSWQAVLQIGNEARARGDAPAARRAYLTALFRARGARALPGVLSAAEGFKALGDRDAVEHALRMVVALGADTADADTSRRLQALRDRTDATDALPTSVHSIR